MAVSATGGSGLDVNGIVTQLMALERRPITKLNQQQSSYQAELSAFGQIKNALTNLQTAMQGLSKSGAFANFSATSSDPNSLTATASTQAVAGQYAVNISSLAQAQQLVTTGQADTTSAIGSGSATTVSFDFGTISGGSFNAATGTYTGASYTSNGAATKSITIDSTNNSLSGIRDAINKGNLGVTASIVNDGSANPNRLVLTSNTTGQSNSVKISVSGDAAVGALLANDPAATQNLSQKVAAQNANFDVNGIAITKASNTVTDVIQGVALNLNKVTTSPLNLTVSKNNQSVTDAANNFVKAYNDVQSLMKRLSAVDPGGKSSAILGGDSTVRNLQSQLFQIIQAPVSGGTTISTLSQVGISTQKDGSLALDSSKFAAALNANPTDVTNLFSSANGTATKLGDWANTVLSNTGMLTSRTDGISKTIADIGKEINRQEGRMTMVEQGLRRQYSALDAMLSSMNQTQKYLTQQLSTLQVNNK